MGISEFTVHNVLRTYARQDRLGQANKARAKGTASPPRTTDQVSLSTTGRKVQWLGQLAAEVVDRQNPELTADDRAHRIRTTKDALLARHRDDVGNDSVSAEALESRLRGLYGGR